MYYLLLVVRDGVRRVCESNVPDRVIPSKSKSVCRMMVVAGTDLAAANVSTQVLQYNCSDR